MRLARVALLGLAACGGHMDPPTENKRMQDVSGSVAVDGKPAAGIDVSLVTADGTTVAVAVTGADGSFHAPRTGAAWAVAKLRGPVIGALARPIGDGAIALAASGTSKLTATMQLPAGAAAVDRFEFGVTPTAIDGVPADVLRTITLDGLGPARVNALATQRTGPRAELRVLPGQYSVVVAHVVEQAKSPTPEPSYVTGGGVIGGQRIAASLDALSIDARHDVAVTVEMIPGG